VDEDLTGKGLCDFICGDATIGASDPENLRALSFREPFEKFRILTESFLYPLLVAVEKRLIYVHNFV
jgi:hypothetical protein